MPYAAVVGPSANLLSARLVPFGKGEHTWGLAWAMSSLRWKVQSDSSAWVRPTRISMVRLALAPHRPHSSMPIPSCEDHVSSSILATTVPMGSRMRNRDAVSVHLCWSPNRKEF
jgi:hypothetical protein